MKSLIVLAGAASALTLSRDRQEPRAAGALTKAAVPTKAAACDACKTAAHASCKAYLNNKCYAANLCSLDKHEVSGCAENWTYSFNNANAGGNYEECFPVHGQTTSYTDNFGDEYNPNGGDGPAGKYKACEEQMAGATPH